MSAAASSKMAANPVAASNSGSPAPNGTPASGEHSRKPSLTIGASGASGYVGNGGPVAPAGSQRRNINFGQMNSDGNPAVANSSPYAAQASLSTPQSDPRVTSPAVSPSPIPQPPSASGGRPPSGLGTQGNNLNFGSIGASDSDLSRSIHAPQGPAMASQPVHLRRQSSQQSDASSTGMQYPQGPSRAQFMPGSGGRGRGGYQGYGQQMNYSPSQNYRQPSGQQRPAQAGYPPPFQNQGAMPYAGSPHPQARSPMPQAPHPNAPMMPQGQQPGGPMMQHQGPYMNPNQPAFQYAPHFNTYAHHLNPQPGQFGQQPGYDPNYQYYQSPYQAPPPHMAHGAPPGSPRNFPKTQGPPPQYMQGAQYNQPTGQSMSRTPSHASTDRPGSSLGGAQPPPPQSQTPSNTSRDYPPSQSATPAFNQSSTQSNFTIPAKRVNKGIVIKDDKGNIVTFDKEKHAATPAPPAVVKSPSPGTTSGAPTPPPVATSTHSRTESKTGKTAEEIKAELRERVLKGLSDDKISEETGSTTPPKDESAPTVTVEPESEAAATPGKEDAEAKAAEAQREKEEAEAEEEKKLAESRAAAEREEQAKKDAELAKAEEVKAEAAAVEAQAAEEAQTASETDPSKLDEDEEMERMIAEMEAKEREEEERERAYAEKRKKDAEEKAAREKEEAANADENLRRAEREAEEAEEARQQQKPEEEESEEAKAEREKLFASLKKPTLGPGADSASGTATPVSDDSMPPPAPQRTASTSKSKPMPLKLDTTKNVEPAQPTAGMQSLKSARMLQLQNEAIAYPEGIKSPNPALIHGTKRAGRVYDQDFLMQFQEVFKEKPSVDWEQKLKETIGDSGDSSAGPKSGRTPVSSRAPSNRGPPPPSYPPMGAFHGGQGSRTLPPGTTSQARFEMSNQRGPTMNNPLANFPGRPGAFPMGNMPVPMARQGSLPGMQHGQSPRNASQRGKSGRQDRVPSRKEQEAQNKAMPLTAGGDVKALEMSKSGWKPMSIAQTQQPLPGDANGRMAPDMVQRKVKANLNKMTPERFDKISDEILKIAAQSKYESDGRTLRQVIALTFEKACDEAHWASMYAKFCARMMEMMTSDLKDENVVDKHGNPVVGGALFRKYLLNRCQEDFEKGWEMNLPEKEEGETEEAAMMSDEYYAAAAAKRKGLGLIQFIGELYKLHMLSLRIMHQCFHKLLDFNGMPDESAIESLVKLMRTVGATMEADHLGDKQGSALVDTYFQRIEKIVVMPGLPSRMHFMLLDVIDLRTAGWQSKDDAKGPKTITEIREEAVAAQQQAELERQRQRVGGGPGGGRAPSGRGDRGYPPPVDVSQNRVASEDLRRLNARQPSRQTSTGPQRTLGPTSAFTRSSSGRQGMGAAGNPMNRTATPADDSNSSSRSASRRDDKSNTFSALAGLENEGTGGTPTSSPPVAKAIPAATTSPTPAPAAPATESSTEGNKPETAESSTEQS